MQAFTPSLEDPAMIRFTLEHLHRSVVECSARGIMIVDAGGVVAFHNRRCTGLLGESESLVGRTLASLVSERDRDLLAAALQATREGVTPRSIEIRLPASARGERLVRLTLTRYGGDGAALGEMEDISEQRALEAQLRHRQRMELMGQLAAGVSHDLKNLLTIVLGNLDLAALDAADGALDSIERAAEAARSGSRLAQQLLGVGRATGEPCAPILLAPTVTKVLALLRSTRPGTIAFLSDIPDTLRVVANAGQLEQAFLNLALNGCEAMPQGGRLRVRAHGIPAPPDGVTLPPQPAGYVQIDVEDSGCGMTPDVAARMFEPFFTTRGSGGSGLGGAVISGIVSDHHGAITVATAPGAGTTVSLYLPAASPIAAVTASAEQQWSPHPDRIP